MTPYAEAVLEVVEQVPRGRVVSYGDVAELMGRGTGRTVATVMSRWGAGVCWHRVLHADGSCADRVRDRQLERLRADGVAVVGGRVDIAAARWDGAGLRLPD